ncbi:MAG: uroporphyrinogen-III C-methyltransferase [Gammaproteobacteria bacterium]|nr:uroporphyrinogen-III C-methyltransferase [Gammaproteobacteria bacterium]
MSERDKTALDMSTAQDADPAVEATDEMARVARPSSSRLSIVLSLVTLAIVALSLYGGYRYWSGIQQSLLQLDGSLAVAGKDQAMIRERLGEAQRALQQQQQQLASQDQALTEQRQLLENERAAMRQQAAQLQRSLSTMQQRQGGGDKQQWQIAEAEYLMRVANHRLSLMHDPLTALQALAAADERLRDTQDPGWHPVRQQLSREMASLQAVPQVDKEALTAQLATLAEQVEQLPLRDERVALQAIQKADVVQGPTASDRTFDLQRIWQDFWEGFKSMMVIRHHAQPITAMLSPEQGYFLRQNLRLKLEGASVALIGRNGAFYRDSLESSAVWVERYFATDSPQVKSFRRQLTEMLEQEVAPGLPVISASLRALQARRDELMQGGEE